MSIATKCTCGYSITGICNGRIKECVQLIPAGKALHPSESATAAQGKEDAVAQEFAEWIRNERWEGRKHVGWINHSHAPIDLMGTKPFYTTHQLYDIYKQSK